MNNYFDDLIADLDETIKNLDELDDMTQSIEINDNVARKYTNHSSAEELFLAAGILNDDTNDIFDEKLDNYLKKFPIGSLDNLYGELAEELISKKIKI